MAGHGRYALLAALWLLTAVAAGVLAAWLLGRSPGAPPSSVVETTSPIRTAEPGSSDSPATASSIVPVAEPPLPVEPAGPNPSSGEASQGPATRGEAVDAVLPVRVLRADGFPVDSGSVYALGAGEEGCGDDGDVLSAEVDDEGTTQLRLPRPGVYDIGYEGGLHAFLAGVEVGPGESPGVVLRIPSGRPVRVEIEGKWPPEGSSQARAWVTLEADPPEGRLRMPGRGQKPRLETLVGLYEGETAVETDPLPESETWLVNTSFQEFFPAESGFSLGHVDSPRFELVPDRQSVRPGETLRLRVRSWPILRVRGDASELTDSGAGDLVIECRTERGVDRRHFKGLNKQGASPPFELWFRLESGRFDLRWSGKGIARGEASGLHAAPGRFHDFNLVLRPDPEGALATDEPVPEAEPAGPVGPEPEMLRLIPEGLPEETDLSAIALLPDDSGNLRPNEMGASWHTSDGTIDHELHGGWRRAGAIRFVAGNSLASEALVPPSSGPLRVPLRPAGLLCVVPDRPLDDGFGSLTVRLVDGGVVPVVEGDSSLAPVVSVGTLLGPLPEGTYRFRVRRSGVTLGEVSATVRAGRIEPLRIPAR